MKCWKSVLVFTLLTIGCILSPSTVVIAQVVGASVQVRTVTPLRIDQQIVAELQVGAVLNVELQQGDWLWVRTKQGERGWVRQSEVQLIPTTATPDSGNTVTNEAQQKLYLIGFIGSLHVTTLHDQVVLLAELNKAKPQEVDLLQVRVRNISQQADQLRGLVKTTLSQRSPPDEETLTRTQLIDLLTNIEQEAGSLQSLIRFPSTETRTQFETDLRRTEDRIRQLAAVSK